MAAGFRSHNKSHGGNITMSKAKSMLIPALIMSVAISGVLSLPARAAETPGSSRNYQFNSGPDTKATFGGPTQTDIPGSNPLLDNIRRNKDVAYLPPGYGIFGGELPTSPSSLYHSADSPASASDASFNGTASVNYYGSSTIMMEPTSLLQSQVNAAAAGNVSVSYTPSVTQPLNTDTALTKPSYYDDGSVGFLSIPAINTYVQVYEGETAANLKLGAAHFENTSSWQGNIGLAGHNRGAHDFFRGVKDIMIGDRITYETMYGTRTYTVYLKEQISDTDFSYLNWSQENIITLITCVIDTPSRRWVIQAREALD
jgi:sortase A